MKNAIPFTSLLIVMVWPCPAQQQWHRAVGTEEIAIAALDVYRKDPDTLYAVGFRVMNGGSRGTLGLHLRSTDGGESWDSVYNLGVDIGALKVDPTTSRIIYSTGFGFDFESNAVIMTSDGGLTWRTLGQGHGFRTVVIQIDPIHPNIVYVGSGSGIVRTTDRGETWHNADSLSGWTWSMAISPTNDSILYVVGGGGIFKSTDLGANWLQLCAVTPVCGGSIAIDPRNAAILYLTVNGQGVYKSSDAGATWEQKNNGLGWRDLDVSAFAINPKRTSELYLGTGSDTVGNRIIFRSNDGGEHWNEFSDGLPDSCQVSSIVIDTLNERLYVGVNTCCDDSSGIYIRDGITEADSSRVTLPEKFVLYQNYPNPFNPNTTIRYKVGAAGSIKLQVYDLLGRWVTTLVDQTQSPGSYSVAWNAGNRSSGVYFYRMESKDAILTKRMLVVK